MTNNIKPSASPAIDVDINEIYRFLTTQYLHQNQLSWSRLQVAFIVEAGILTWFFSSINSTIPMFVITIGIILGCIVIWMLYQLVLRDWEIRDQNEDFLNKIHQPFGIELLKKKCKNGFRGRNIAPCLTYGSIIINIILLILRCYHFI
jgi:hypothetical protein